MNTKTPQILWQLETQTPYVMEECWDIVCAMVYWVISLEEGTKQLEWEISRITRASKELDVQYESWAMGRLGIMDGWPNYIGLFQSQKQKVLSILRENWFS